MHRFLFALFVLSPLFPQVFAQDADPQPDPQPQQAPVGRRYTFGGRFHYSPDIPFNTTTATSSTTKPIADYTYSGSSQQSKLGASASFEFRITSHLSIGAELGGRQVSYSEVTTIRSGIKDPNATTDNRPVTTLTQNTRANYLEIPMLARYYSIVPKGLLSHIYLMGGLAYRHIGNIKTGNDTSNADGTTAYNEIPATPLRTNQAGYAAGAGLRFIDEVRLRIMPEIRYTHWQGSTFQGPSYRSNQSQLEAGLGFSF